MIKQSFPSNYLKNCVTSGEYTLSKLCCNYIYATLPTNKCTESNKLIGKTIKIVGNGITQIATIENVIDSSIIKIDKNTLTITGTAYDPSLIYTPGSHLIETTKGSPFQDINEWPDTYTSEQTSRLIGSNIVYMPHYNNGGDPVAYLQCKYTMSIDVVNKDTVTIRGYFYRLVVTLGGYNSFLFPDIGGIGYMQSSVSGDVDYIIKIDNQLSLHQLYIAPVFQVYFSGNPSSEQKTATFSCNITNLKLVDCQGNIIESGDKCLIPTNYIGTSPTISIY